MRVAEPNYQAEMQLPQEATCDDCRHAKRCFGFGFSKPGNKSCDFWPSRFARRADDVEKREPMSLIADRFYICSQCAAKRGAEWPAGHRGSAHEAKCPFCSQTRMLTSVTDWRWPVHGESEDHMKPSRIETVKQSPLNPKQWCCQLDCGHDQWITAKRRPTRHTLLCDRCVRMENERRRSLLE